MGNCFSEDNQGQPAADGSPPENSTSSATADQDNAATQEESSPQQEAPAAEPATAEPEPTAPAPAPEPEPAPAAPAAPAEPPPIGAVLGRPMHDVRATYTLGKELGRGEFGVTYLCTDKVTGEQFACKTINKRRLTCDEDFEDVRREVKIMQHLKGKPNIVDLIAAFEDKQSVYLIMDLCAGGDVIDRILDRGGRHYTERAAASLLRTIVQVIQTCHSMGVMHRGLKPEDFLLLNGDEDAPLKATDFGVSIFFKEGDEFTDIVGSTFYVAPEVLKSKYGPEADIWSIGVMLYIFLCGVPPFWAESEREIFNAILKGYIDFVSHPWPNISSGAKDLVRKMINSDPQQRLTAAEVLDHPWIKEDGEAPDTPIDKSVVKKLKRFRAMNQFKKAALTLMAGCLSEEELTGLKEIFKNMDSDNSGIITLEELGQVLANQGTKLTDYEVQQLMESAEVEGNETIDYEEFITETVQMSRMDREDNLYAAFQFFDKDNSGFITTEELVQALKEKGMYDGEEIKGAISEADAENNGKINYDEFEAMMRKRNEQNNPSF